MALAVTGYFLAAFSSHETRSPTPTIMPMAIRTGGISQPWFMEYRRKNTAARSSATPAIQEKKFHPNQALPVQLGHSFQEGAAGIGDFGIGGGSDGGRSRASGTGEGDSAATRGSPVSSW